MEINRPTYSLEECINYIGLGKYQWRLISILGFCTMADAVEMMLLAILGPALSCYWSDITQMQIATLTTVCIQFTRDEDEEDFLYFFFKGVFAGMMFGAVTFGMIADRYGRWRVIAISAVLNTLFGLFTAIAPTYHAVLFARVCVGVALSGAAQGFVKNFQENLFFIYFVFLQSNINVGIFTIN